MWYLCVLLLAVCRAEVMPDGGQAFRVPLSDGTSMPTLGLGTYAGLDQHGQNMPKPNEVTWAVEWAIDSGYRLIDTAPVYQGEDQIGVAIDRKIKGYYVKRKDLYVVTKLPSTSHAKDQVVPTLKASLKSLRLDYVDLFLIHWPMGFTSNHTDDHTDFLETWRGMEEAKEKGLAKSIGLSNFNKAQIEKLLKNCKVKPTVLQIEVNIHLAQNDLINYCKKQNIVVMAYSPFGRMFTKGMDATKADETKLGEIANQYTKSSTQLVLRYLVQRGIVPIPTSFDKTRIKQNIQILDFTIKEDDLQTIAEMNRNQRTVQPTQWQHHKDYPFEKTAKQDKAPF